jgi:hypothetical protein
MDTNLCLAAVAVLLALVAVYLVAPWKKTRQGFAAGGAPLVIPLQMSASMGVPVASVSVDGGAPFAAIAGSGTPFLVAPGAAAAGAPADFPPYVMSFASGLPDAMTFRSAPVSAGGVGMGALVFGAVSASASNSQQGVLGLMSSANFSPAPGVVDQLSTTFIRFDLRGAAPTLTLSSAPLPAVPGVSIVAAAPLTGTGYYSANLMFADSATGEAGLKSVIIDTGSAGSHVPPGTPSMASGAVPIVFPEGGLTLASPKNDSPLTGTAVLGVSDMVGFVVTIDISLAAVIAVQQVVGSSTTPDGKVISGMFTLSR